MTTSSSGSSKSKQVERLTDLIEQADSVNAKQRKTTKSAEQQQSAELNQKFASIEANPFKKILWDPNLSPEQKKSEIAKALAFNVSDPKEVNQKRLAELELFKEWLQFQRKEMSQRLISLTDTEAFSELKMVYDEINNALLDFDNKMQPLTDIVDAVFDLRMAGGDVIFDIFREIKEDKAEEERRRALQEQQRAKLEELLNSVNRLNMRRAVLQNQRSFFGLGGLKSSAREEIAKIELVDLVALETAKSGLQKEIEQTAQEFQAPRESRYADLVKQKEKLRELVDISSAEHKERQKALVEAANHFVDTTEKRVGTVMQHLEQRNKHIDGVAEMNDSMESIYAILREAEKDAEQNNQQLRTQTAQEVEAEQSAIAKMQKERQLRAVEEHITALDTVAVDTGSTLAELSNSSFQIKSMKDGNQQQIAKTRAIQSSGVAGVAQRLATTLDALSGAALNEASEMTNLSLGMMNDKTNRTIAKDALRRAAGIKGQSDSLGKAIEDLAAMGQVIRKASDMTRENVRAVKEKISGLEEVTKEIQENVNAAYGINADVGAELKSGAEKKSDDGEQPKDKDGSSLGSFKI